jgi:GTPase Era involved in 16S rRNA processing
VVSMNKHDVRDMIHKAYWKAVKIADCLTYAVEETQFAKKTKVAASNVKEVVKDGVSKVVDKINEYR